MGCTQAAGRPLEIDFVDIDIGAPAARSPVHVLDTQHPTPRHATRQSRSMQNEAFTLQDDKFQNKFKVSSGAEPNDQSGATGKKHPKIRSSRRPGRPLKSHVTSYIFDLKGEKMHRFGLFRL